MVTQKELNERYSKAHALMMVGYNHHDTDKLLAQGIVSDPQEVEQITDDMYDIYRNILFIQSHDLSESLVNTYEHLPKGETTLMIGQIRSELNKLSTLMLQDGHGINEAISEEALKFAVDFTVFENDPNVEELLNVEIN